MIKSILYLLLAGFLILPTNSHSFYSSNRPTLKDEQLKESLKKKGIALGKIALGTTGVIGSPVLVWALSKNDFCSRCSVECKHCNRVSYCCKTMYNSTALCSCPGCRDIDNIKMSISLAIQSAALIKNGFQELFN